MGGSAEVRTSQCEEEETLGMSTAPETVDVDDLEDHSPSLRQHVMVDSKLVDSKLEEGPATPRQASGGAPGVLPTMPNSVHEMQVVTTRGGRSGSLSKYLDDTETIRRRSLHAMPDDVHASNAQAKRMSLSLFLEMAIDPILEVLEDAESDVRLWLMQPETVRAVIAEFISPPNLMGEPHEEYGYYKNYFVCSEIIMKLYTGEEDLYESFSSDSSSGSATVTAVFGCIDPEDLEHWEQLYSIFKQPAPLDEMQLLFYSKALVRLHDGFCLEDGYVANVLRPFLPLVVPHLYSNMVKYMVTLILQSYESVHPITGRNDALEILAPPLVSALRKNTQDSLAATRVENAAQLLLDMLQANQADRLGAFCRREGGITLSKYFVRDQFGTIRGFESTAHGYHNFLQYMFLEELGKETDLVNAIFTYGHMELALMRNGVSTDAPSVLVVQVATELLNLYMKHGRNNEDSVMDNQQEDDAASEAIEDNVPMSNSFLNSPPSAAEAVMYNLKSLSHREELWTAVLDSARRTARDFTINFGEGAPSSTEVALAKHLLSLVKLNDSEVDDGLHKGGLITRYLDNLQKRPRFDMLLIHVMPALTYIIRDPHQTRSKTCPLTKAMFVSENGHPTVLDLIAKSKDQIPYLQIHVKVLQEAIEEITSSKSHSANNSQVAQYCRRNSLLGRLMSKRPSRMLTRRRSSIESSRNSSTSDRKSSASDQGDVPEDAVVSNQDDLDTTPGAAEDDAMVNGEGESTRRSSYYLKQVLQTPVFRNSVKLGASVVRASEKVTSPLSKPSELTGASQRNSFGFNSMLKRLRKSLVPTSGDKGGKKLLAITNGACSSGAPSQNEVLMLDTSKGDDVTAFVHHDGGVSVLDVPASGHSAEPNNLNVVTSGYMYKSKLSETGQRHAWERFFFVLDRSEGLLTYYVSEAHAKDRTFLRGTIRPLSVTEGIPVSVAGQQNVCGFQVNTQGHGTFMLLVDSIDTRLVWLAELLVCINASSSNQAKRNSLLGDRGSRVSDLSDTGEVCKLSRQEMKSMVEDFYKNLFGPNLRFSSPMEAPASFWMEEIIDPLHESCVLSSNLPNCVPFWGEFHGFRRLCDYWRIRDETIERSSGRVLRIIVDDEEETAVVMTTSTFRVLRNSEVVTEESCDLISFCSGKIVSIHCTYDSYRIAEAFQKDGVSAS